MRGHRHGCRPTPRFRCGVPLSAGAHVLVGPRDLERVEPPHAGAHRGIAAQGGGRRGGQAGPRVRRQLEGPRGQQPADAHRLEHKVRGDERDALVEGGAGLCGGGALLEVALHDGAHNLRLDYWRGAKQAGASGVFARPEASRTVRSLGSPSTALPPCAAIAARSSSSRRASPPSSASEQPANTSCAATSSVTDGKLDGDVFARGGDGGAAPSPSAAPLPSSAPSRVSIAVPEGGHAGCGRVLIPCLITAHPSTVSPPDVLKQAHRRRPQEAGRVAVGPAPAVPRAAAPHDRQRQREAAGRAAGLRGLQRMAGDQHIRLLPVRQHALRGHLRVVHHVDVSDHVGPERRRIPLDRQPAQDPQGLGAPVRRLCHHPDPVAAQRRVDIPDKGRPRLSKGLCAQRRQAHIPPPLPRPRAPVPRPLRGRGRVGLRGPPEHPLREHMELRDDIRSP